MNEDRIKLIEQQLLVLRQDFAGLANTVNQTMKLIVANQQAVFIAFNDRLIQMEEFANAKIDSAAQTTPDTK